MTEPSVKPCEDCQNLRLGGHLVPRPHAFMELTPPPAESKHMAHYRCTVCGTEHAISRPPARPDA